MPREFEEVRATIADDAGASPEQLLARICDTAGLWAELELTCTRLDTGPADLSIVIKPDLGAFSVKSPAATDPRLVEHLVDLLHDRGYSQVSIVASSDTSAVWVENRDVLALTDLLGYRYGTSAGNVYDVRDLAEDLLPVDFTAGGLLAGSHLSTSWLDAGFRIVFAKNKTDELEGFALALDSLIGVLPLQDKDYYYRQRYHPGSVVVELLQAAPPQFALIDAFVSCHGSGGARAPVALDTRTIIASPSPTLADFAGALKMGVDPYVSRVASAVLRSFGLPRRYRIDGNLAVYDGWRPVHPMAIDAVRKRDAWVSVSRTMRPWLQQLDPVRFPLKDPVNVRVNEFLAPRFANLDADDAEFALYVAGNYGIGLLYDLFNAYQVLESKDGVRRRHVALGIEPSHFPISDYESPLDELLQLSRLLKDRPADQNGLKWMYVGEAVVFAIERRFPVGFDEFVASIDVARTIQFMNDYLGGVIVPVQHDEHGRVTHQAERNLYLPQPNYLVLSKGQVIDVSKLEYIQYSNDRQRMSWKTIKSENGSATYDDGIVTFTRLPSGTLVNIFGRQLFTLPPFWQAINLDLVPTLKSELVTHAYTTFFQRTFSNFEALLEGREILLGKSWHVPDDPSQTEPLLGDKVAQSVTELLQQHGPALTAAFRTVRRREPATVDEVGFSHFTPGRPAVAEDAVSERESLARSWSEFWAGLAAAARRDFEAMGRRREGSA